MTTLKRQFQLSGQQSQFVRQIPALMGLSSGATNVSGSLGLYYVRLWQGQPFGWATATNPNSIAASADDPIWVDVFQDGRVVIKGIRYIV
jgi:hypothetical protein